MDRFNGDTAVIKGAAIGIGLATSKLIIKEGASVIGIDRTDATNNRGPC